MGGNQRYAAKGPDRRSSECGQCGTEFTHGKFSHPTYCESCREHRRDPDAVTTDLDLDVDTDTSRVTATVTITNGNDVPVRDIPAERPDDSHADIVGYLRIEDDNGAFAVENAWIENLDYGVLKLRPEHSKSVTFVWEDGECSQENTPQGYDGEPVGEDFRERVAMSRGDPFDTDELTATFIPAVDCPELDEATDTATVPSFLIDL